MGTFDLGRTLSRTFALTFGTLASVGLFILIVQAVGLLIQYFAEQWLMDDMANAAASNGPAGVFAIFSSAGYWGSTLLTFLTVTMTVGGATAGFLKRAAGEPTSVGDCFLVALSKFLPLLGLLILLILGVMAGFLLLIAPGVILFCMWSVSVPALIGENRGVIGAFRRSRELTKGSRDMIFVTLLIVLIMIYGAMSAVMVVLISGALGSGMLGSVMMGRTSLWVTVAMLPSQWLFAALLNAVLVSIYLETVTIKEGGRPGELVQVFD